MLRIFATNTASVRIGVSTVTVGTRVDAFKVRTSGATSATQLGSGCDRGVIVDAETKGGK